MLQKIQDFLLLFGPQPGDQLWRIVRGREGVRNAAGTRVLLHMVVTKHHPLLDVEVG